MFVVDDDLSARKGIARLLRTANYDVRDFGSADEFLGALDSEMPGCVVLDARIPRLSVEEMRAKTKRRAAHVPVIVVTTYDDPETRGKARKLNAVAFFRKPVDGAALLDAIDWAMRSGSAHL